MKPRDSTIRPPRIGPARHDGHGRGNGQRHADSLECPQNEKIGEPRCEHEGKGAETHHQQSRLDDDLPFADPVAEPAHDGLEEGAGQAEQGKKNADADGLGKGEPRRRQLGHIKRQDDKENAVSQGVRQPGERERHDGAVDAQIFEKAHAMFP
ncbi:MAG: hypothetical protein P8018_13675 [Acidobacteriota bacterium]